MATVASGVRDTSSAVGRLQIRRRVAGLPPPPPPPGRGETERWPAASVRMRALHQRFFV